MSDELREVDLITGQERLVSRDEQGLCKIVTEHFKQVLGGCENGCEWDMRYGWVPESDCPVHDA